MMDVLHRNARPTHRTHQAEQAASTDHVRRGNRSHSQSQSQAFDGCFNGADREILDLVKQALHECGIQPLRRVNAYCDDGRITLQGRVSSYYLKQVAQEVVRSVADVRDIDNDLHVLSQ